MGKGDKRSKRGKIWRGTFGKTRPKHKSTGTKTASTTPAKAPVKSKPKAKAAK